MQARDILKTADDERVRFLRLQFTDILGVIKNVEVPRSQFEKALDGQILFDGSSIEGFSRIEESDMLLVPDLATFIVNPWANPDGSRVARMICDVHLPDGTPFAGCPRLTLKRQVARAAKLGYRMVAGPEAEFFLFQKDERGGTRVATHDVGGYFDLTPVDRGEECRRDIVGTGTWRHSKIVELEFPAASRCGHRHQRHTDRYCAGARGVCSIESHRECLRFTSTLVANRPAGASCPQRVNLTAGNSESQKQLKRPLF